MRGSRAWAAVAFAALASPAAAHAPSAGLQGFYNAAPHILTEPAQWLLLAGLAVWMSQADDAPAETAIGLMLLAAATGLAIALVAPFPSERLTSGALALAALLGLLATIRAPLAWAMRVGLGIAAGLLAGAYSAPDAGPLSAVLWSGAGALAGAMLVFLLMLAGLLRLSRAERLSGFMDVATRVLGAWIAAASLLAAALVWRRIF